jgi:septum formation protein
MDYVNIIWGSFMKPILILASTSPRRRELLELANIPFSIRIQDVDESVIIEDDPAQTALELSIYKAKHVPFNAMNEVIITADTVVAYKGQIYGKPGTSEEAFDMLSNLSGDVHEVFTGVTIRSKEKEVSFVERTLVEFWPLSDGDINDYIATGDVYDKAGAYGIQSKGATLVKKINGDYYNVVGLPISRVVRELRQFNIKRQ